MSGLSINNLNSGNVAYAGYSAQSNDNNSMKNTEPLSSLDSSESLPSWAFFLNPRSPSSFLVSLIKVTIVNN